MQHQIDETMDDSEPGLLMTRFMRSGHTGDVGGARALCGASAVQRKLIKSLSFYTIGIAQRDGVERIGCFACASCISFQASNKNSRQMAQPRPKYLDLIHIRLPLPGLISILHRISGALLFLSLPFLLCLWQQSLASQQSFDAFSAVVSRPLVKLALLGLLWGYLHHLCAGIRHLALDLDIGTELAAARASSVAVLVISIGLTLVTGVVLW